MYGLTMKSPEEVREWAKQRQLEHNQDVCERMATTSYKLKRMAGGAALAPSLPVFPLAIGVALGGDSPEYAPFALSAVSALTVVPFIMKWPMKKASYGRRFAVGNGILAALGAAYSLYSTSKQRERVCSPHKPPPPSGRGYPIGRPTP